MKNRQPDPELMRLLRTAGWLWLGFLVALVLIDRFLFRTAPSMVIFYLTNGLAAILFLAFAYWTWFARLLRSLHLPLMLGLIAGLPLVANHLLSSGLLPGGMSSPEGMALRQLPILFVALVITAWQYGLAGVILFSGVTLLLEIFMVIFVAPWVVFVNAPAPGMPGGFTPIPFRTLDIFIFLALVRTVSFMVVGVFISSLVHRLRRQQQSLAEANTRLRHHASTLESLTVSRERNRMAHELHDTLAHSLTALSVQLETVKAYWSRDRRKARQLLDQSLAATRSGLDETRRALRSLRAAPLEELGLLLALRQLAESAASRGGLQLQLSLPGSLPILPPDVEQGIYRIAQEALENTLAHGGAQNLVIDLQYAGTSLALTISDDGSGFDLARAEQNGHFGLVGMRERAEMIGGGFTVHSSPGSGTSLTLQLEVRS